MIPMSYNNDQDVMVTVRMQLWHTCFDGNQQHSNWNDDPLNKRETVIGTGNQANCPRVVNSWIVKENL